MGSSHTVRRLEANHVSCVFLRLPRIQVTYQDFLRIADTPCEVPDRTVRLYHLGGKLDTEPASRQSVVLQA